MQESDMTIDGQAYQDCEAVKQRLWDLLVYGFKKLVLFVSMGPGVLGVVWLLGKIWKR